jgi:alpha-maltose-1-phosphate synthase
LSPGRACQGVRGESVSVYAIGDYSDAIGRVALGNVASPPRMGVGYDQVSTSRQPISKQEHRFPESAVARKVLVGNPDTPHAAATACTSEKESDFVSTAQLPMDDVRREQAGSGNSPGAKASYVESGLGFKRPFGTNTPRFPRDELLSFSFRTRGRVCSVLSETILRAYSLQLKIAYLHRRPQSHPRREPPVGFGASFFRFYAGIDKCREVGVLCAGASMHRAFSSEGALPSQALMLTGVIGSGQMGRDPFDRRSWSGSSFFFFDTIRRRQRLRDAIGVEAPRLTRAALLARNFRLPRSAWRARFYLDTAYRDSLTAEVARKLRLTGVEGVGLLQVGALYDVPSVVRGQAPCFSYHDGNLAERLRSGRGFVGISRAVIDRALGYEAAIYEKLDLVFTMSEHLRASFIDDFGVPAARVVNIGAGVNLESVPQPRDWEEHPPGRQLLFVGVDFERKGGAILLEAFRAVKARFPDSVLHIVGPPKLHIPASQSQGVVHHGFLDKSHPADQVILQQLLSTCSIFVMPSLHEPFGIAPLEAMLHELPAVVTDAWALREMVTPGRTGELVRRADSEDLADKLVSLLADPARIAGMGAAARSFVLGYYTWDSVVSRLLDAIDGYSNK